MQEVGISKKVRLIMAAAAIGLIGIVFILMFLQSQVQEKWLSQTGLRKVPALGPVEARPATPEFSAKEAMGMDFQLKDLKGKVLYINFWAEWCLPCIKEMPIINRLQQKYSEQGFQSLMINMDYSEDSVKKAMKLKNELAPLAMGVFENQKDFQQRFLVEALPFHILVDRNGRTAASFYASLEDQEERLDDLINTLLLE